MTPPASGRWLHPGAACALAMLIAVAVLFVAAGPANAAPDLTYGCSPPLTPTPESCDAWHTGPVTIIWKWDSFAAEPVSQGDCDPGTFSADNAALPVSCTVKSLINGSTTSETALLHIDSTAPHVIAAIPNRAPDFGGWWNHAVGYTFSGTDATSGIASCAPLLFSGPGPQVVGTCRDKAGNVGVGTFSVAYDSTPPTLTDVTAQAGNRNATVSWLASPDTVRVQVTRTPGPSAPIYDGMGAQLHDRSLSNGVNYRFTVTAFDQAGNPASTSVSARPALSKGLVPAGGATLTTPPLLRWPRVKGATYYNVQMYRGKRKVLTTWPERPRLKLHRSWRYHHRRMHLRPGRYRWYVWPGRGSRAAHSYGALIGHSSFVIGT